MSSIDKEWVENHIDSNGEVVIPEGIEKIEAEAFKDNKLVRKVVMPNTLTEIGDNAFSGCTNLEDIEFSENLKTIGENAFLGSKINLNSKETAHEIAQRFKTNPRTEAQYQEIVKWCSENCDKLDLKDEDQQYLYEMSTRYLMKYRIGKWEKSDANVIINYLAKKSAWKMGIDENVTVKILEQEEYKKIHGDSSGVCVNNGDDTFNISYSPRVMENLLSYNYDQFLRGMQTIFHEVVHAQQNSVIQRSNINGVEVPKTKTIYIMALETIARKFDPKFYDSNYSHLIKENHAEKFGLKEAMDTMQKYNPKLFQAYNQEIIQQRLDNYDKNFYEADVTLNSGRTVDFMLQIDTLSSMYIEQHPEIIEKFPILQVGYNLDGTKKDLSQLIPERDKMLVDSDTPDKINELYEAIANHRNVLTGGLKGTKDELYTLHDYIEKTGTEDDFIYSLIKYRLEHKAKMSPEQITEFMEREYASAAKTRQEREEQEIEYEESESIKDEIGDEFKPKTEQQKQEERQVESMWQNRFQSWDRDTAILPDGAKKKSEAVQVMQDLQRQQDKEKQNQEQLDNQNNDQR